MKRRAAVRQRCSRTPTAKSVSVRAGDGALCVDVVGTGSPVVLIHGFPLDRSMWRDLVPELPAWRRIAPDLRGMGSSVFPPGDWSMRDYADDLATLLDTLELPRAVFCGLSMGGYVAFELWRREPERVTALVLANTRAAADSPQARRGRDDAIALVTAHGAGALVESMLPRLLAPNAASRLPGVVQHVRDMIVRNNRDGVVRALRAMKEREDATHLLSTVSVPVLVVAGAKDQIVSEAEARAMARALPDARLAIIPEAGHLAPLEQPATVGRTLRAFLESLA